MTEQDKTKQDETRQDGVRQDEERHEGGLEPEVDVMVKLPSSPIALSSSMVTPKVQQKIPIDEAYLQYINTDPDAVQGIRNIQSRSKGSGETFVSMTVLHKKHGVASSAKVYKCINGF